ncbi:hypothetical protein [Clostridium butyricum]|uniref:hypothetical protein n=1 Tax=Clostridium butyricum TaxID=1492 RepID=UPI002ABD8F6B|nr:hypothetical protein [Clostridium butyricum]
MEEGWYQRARIEGTFKIKVSYSYDNVGEIYYIKEDGMNYDTLTLVTYMEQYKNLTEEELIKVLEYQQKMNNDAREKEIREKVALFDEIEKITNKAKEEQEKNRDKAISKTQRLKNIRENLNNERKYIRNKQENYEEENEIDEFNEILKEEWGEEYE